MTGDLTFNTDKIVFDAETGTGTFEEDVLVGDEVASRRANFNYDAGAEGQVLGIYNGTGTSNPTIALNHDGSAAFSGAVDVGPFDDGSSGTRITNSGTIYNLGTGANAAHWIGSDLSDDPAIKLNFDGSAS